MVKMKEQDNGLFFVQVKEPSEIRRNILETLKGIVEALQRFEKFKHMRHKKIEQIQKLRGLLKDANKMLGTLKLKLPQTNLRATVAREAPTYPVHAKEVHHKKKKKGKSAKSEEKAPKKEPTEIEKLEAELSAIESKLKSLT